MSKKVSPRLLFLPLVVLLFCLALYGVIEQRKLSNDTLVRDAINDPLAPMAQVLQVSALDLRSIYDRHKPGEEFTDNNTQSVRLGLTNIIQKQEEISNYIAGNGAHAEEYLDELDFLRRIAVGLKEMNHNFETFACKDIKVWQESRSKLDFVVGQAQLLMDSIQKKHTAKANRLLDQIVQNERQRALLLVFVLISGLVLVVILLDTIHHYKASAERASAAEKCNALFAAALQNTRVGVLIRDMRREGKPVVFINAAFTQLTGYAFEDLHGESSDFLFGWRSARDAVAAFRRAIHLHETTILDVVLYRKDGSPFWSEWHLSPIMGEDGKLAYYVSLFNDTTAIREAQDDLTQAKAAAEHASAIKSTFLAMMSHEIRTPINGILGIIRLMEETRLDQEQQHLLSVAKTSSSVLHGIINDILDYAKMEAGKIEIVPEPFDVRALIQELAGLGRSLLGDKEVDLDFDVSDEVPQWMYGDVGRLRQIILNLMSNAIKFTESGFIRIRALPLLHQEVNGKPGTLMRFEVHDTGEGISAENIGKLFQEFSQVERTFTRRFGGTGLGLAICRRLVEMMGGEINVESQPGKGSRFWFILPFQTTKAPVSELSAAQAEINKPKGPARAVSSVRILLVEDNETNRLVASKFLEKLGFHVDEACDGQQAIEMVQIIKYDLILMDVSMPVMDGMMATQHIRRLDERNASVPIVALTAHAMEGDRQLCLGAGMNDYLQKPLNYADLVKILERWLNIELSDDGVQRFKERGVEIPTSFDKDAPIFEGRVLQTMQNELGGAVVNQVATVFLKDSASRIDAFLGAKKMEEVRDAAHTLKSCSANCGLMRFSALMAAIEAEASKKDEEHVRVLLRLVSETYKESCQALENERERYQN